MEKGIQKKQENSNGTRVISIKAKLLGIILPMVIILIISLVAISYNITKGIIEESARDLLSSSIENQAGKIEAWLDKNLSAFNIVKQTIEGMNPSEEELELMLNQYYDFDSNYPDGIYIADEKGNLIKAKSSEKSGSNVTDTEWYQEGLTRVNMAFTNAYTNENGEKIISACGILKGDSEDMRVISADMSLQRISITVNSLIDMEDAQAFLVDGTDNSILAHRDSSLISTKLEDMDGQFEKGVLEKLNNYDYEISEIAGNMTAFAEIEGTDWILVSYIPTVTIYKDIDDVRKIMILIGFISVAILAILIEIVIHLIIRPIKELTQVITSMTAGDFTVQIKEYGNDEIGVMNQCVEKFVKSMRNMIDSIYGVSGKLQQQADSSNNVSGQMYDASRLQSQSTKELNRTVEQLSASVNEIAENATTLALVVADTRENSERVDEKMKETVEISQCGKVDMQNVDKAMTSINNSVIKMQQAIDKVGKASEEITNITSAMADIAEETKLLSLNASIEAAKAGDSGRGFAVVATEIGHLAQTSAASAQSIEKLIWEINALVQDAVGQAGDSVANINNSSELVGKALKTFDTIFQNIDIVSQLVQQVIEKVEKVDNVASNVAAISEEQAASSEEILASSDTLVEQANNIMDNSGSVAAGAKELTASAEELSDQVRVFKIE